MRKQKAQPLGDVLTEFLRENNLESQLLERHVVEAWPTVIGPTLVRYCDTPTIKDGTLYVRVQSAPLRQEFFLGRFELVKRLNDAVGARVINDIRLLG